MFKGCINNKNKEPDVIHRALLFNISIIFAPQMTENRLHIAPQTLSNKCYDRGFSEWILRNRALHVNFN